MRVARAAGVTVLGLAVAACGGGSGSPAPPTVAPAKEYTLDWQGPKTVAAPGRVTLRLAVRTPDGKVLTRYRTGAGPHTGVHVIIVRDDLSSIIHKHPPIPASGRLALPVTLPSAGRYRVLVDVYPAADSGPRNFQLTHDLQVGAGDVKAPLPAYAPVVKTGGLTFRVVKLPVLRLAEPAAMVVDVTDAQGKPVTFTPFYGALAHAIFFRAGSLDYFHSHICGTDPACAAGFGGPATTGRSSRPGRLELGILLPAGGRWRLFLQVTHGGKLLTAPITLKVR
ncbi:MAG: hypothetical protein QOD65_354 [Gaiellales bacterium]|nr:hypothetical protein [Gaiellales bacterium]